MNTRAAHGILPLVLAALPFWAGCGDEAVGPTENPAVTAAEATITAGDVAEREGVLAADSMKGRSTARPELEVAAAYIAGELSDLGLEPAGTDGFYQRFPFRYTRLDTTDVAMGLEGGGPGLEYRRDFAVVGSAMGDTAGEIVWAGPRSSPDTVPQLGKVVLYDLPVDQLDLTALPEIFAAEAEVYHSGVVGLGFVVGPGFDAEAMARAAAATSGWSRSQAMFWITDAAARDVLVAVGADLDSLRAQGPQVVGGRLRVRADTAIESLAPPNVVGVLRGSDPALRDEYVVVSAHYDHIGTGIPDATGDSIYNGADDNASGTTAVLEVAEALASMEEPPARSVLFLLVSGEEWGLLGSEHFTRSPTVPMSQIVADINLDMVGRNAPGEVYGVGLDYSSLGDLAVTLAAEHPSVGLAVVPYANPGEHLFGRSDQRSFACAGVPAVFFTSGLHDDYHQPSDEVDALDTGKIASVARLALRLAYAVADNGGRPGWTGDGELALAQMSCPQ